MVAGGALGSMARHGDRVAAFSNVAGQTALGLFVVWVGYYLGVRAIQ